MKPLTQKETDKLLDKIMNKALDDLDKSMNKIENSKDWKKLEEQGLSLSIVCTTLIKHLSSNIYSMWDITFLKKQLKYTLEWVSRLDVCRQKNALITAKKQAKEITLN